MPLDMHVEDLLPAYALSSLDEDEVVLVTEHLAVCEACRAQLAACQATVNGLLLSAPRAAPSPDSRRRLMRRIQRMKSTAAAFPPKQPWWKHLPRLIQPVPSRAAFAFGLVAVAVIITLLFNNLSLSRQLQQAQSDESQRALQSPNPYLVMLRGTPLMPEARGIILINTDSHQAVLIVEGLQPLDNLAYQLWLNRYDHLATAGYFNVTDAGRRAIELTAPDSFFNYRAFVITIEPSGGSSEPTGDRVMDGFLDFLEMFDSFDRK